MRKTFPLLLLFVMLLSPQLTSASTSDSATGSSTLRDQKKDAIRSAQEKYKEDRTTAREEFKTTVRDTKQEFRDDIAQKHADRLSFRFNNYYSRLQQLIEKLQAKINEFEGKGQDVTTAQTKLDQAKDALEKAKTAADQSVQGFLNIDPEEYQAQRTAALKARDLASQARQQFAMTLRLLKEVVQLLRSIK